MHTQFALKTELVPGHGCNDIRGDLDTVEGIEGLLRECQDCSQILPEKGAWPRLKLPLWDITEA